MPHQSVLCVVMRRPIFWVKVSCLLSAVKFNSFTNRHLRHPQPPHWPNDMTDVKLWCFVEGQTRYFDVYTPPNQDISYLKRQICAEGVHFFAQRHLDASHLTLTKVRYIMISM